EGGRLQPLRWGGGAGDGAPLRAGHESVIIPATVAVLSAARHGPPTARPSSVTARLSRAAGRCNVAAAAAYTARSTTVAHGRRRDRTARSSAMRNSRPSSAWARMWSFAILAGSI